MICTVLAIGSAGIILWQPYSLSALVLQINELPVAEPGHQVQQRYLMFNEWKMKWRGSTTGDEHLLIGSNDSIHLHSPRAF